MLTNTTLIVEDDVTSCELFKEWFSHANLGNFIIVNDGLSAIEACKNNKDIQLVLLDLKLPDMDGIQVFHEIKKQKFDMPVILQTACDTEGARQNYIRYGFEDYLSKPIDPVLLALTVNKHLVQLAC